MVRTCPCPCPYPCPCSHPLHHQTRHHQFVPVGRSLARPSRPHTGPIPTAQGPQRGSDTLTPFHHSLLVLSELHSLQNASKTLQQGVPQRPKQPEHLLVPPGRPQRGRDRGTGGAWHPGDASPPPGAQGKELTLRGKQNKKQEATQPHHPPGVSARTQAPTTSVVTHKKGQKAQKGSGEDGVPCLAPGSSPPAGVPEGAVPRLCRGHPKAWWHRGTLRAATLPPPPQIHPHPSSQSGTVGSGKLRKGAKGGEIPTFGEEEAP